VGAEHHRLGPVVQAVLDGGEGRHNAGVVRDLPLLLRYVEVAPAGTQAKSANARDGQRNFNKRTEKNQKGVNVPFFGPIYTASFLTKISYSGVNISVNFYVPPGTGFELKRL
jgi:hypothetical protein